RREVVGLDQGRRRRSINSLSEFGRRHRNRSGSNFLLGDDAGAPPVAPCGGACCSAPPPIYFLLSKYRGGAEHVPPPHLVHWSAPTAPPRNTRWSGRKCLLRIAIVVITSLIGRGFGLALERQDGRPGLVLGCRQVAVRDIERGVRFSGLGVTQREFLK